MCEDSNGSYAQPWNKGLLAGQKKPLQPKHVWSIHVRLELSKSPRDLALLNLAIDSKLRACDLVRLRVNDLCQSGMARDRATVIQQKTDKPVKFEVTKHTRLAFEKLLAYLPVGGTRYLSRGVPNTGLIFPQGNTRGFFTRGSKASDWKQPCTAPTHYDEQRLQSCIGRPATYSPCNFYWVAPSWRVQRDISA